MANAEHNDQIDSAELFVAECYCDEGPTLKRWRPRAKGRATRILEPRVVGHWPDTRSI